ncbi:MAG: helix-turn-helix transcriptional regulator [Bdellovibrionaceae bacterium]|nr:helix-turn-helix transcriptional regulator [Bdellovibrionales bacterium]MCB9085001.1 helix-turn-helix transcriptional regulator [Pseudobdellovibrionaceae bacterium]
MSATSVITVPFHERLRSLRKAKGLTMREMARRVGVPETTYREWEVGRAIQGEPYVRMSEALGVSLSELLTGHRPDQAKLLVEIETMEEGLRQLKNKLNAML